MQVLESRSNIALLDSLCDLAGRERSMVAVLVAAHPDDEIIGAGLALSSLPKGWVIHVTDGAPRNMDDAFSLGFATRQEYARVRRAEAIAGLAFCGVAEQHAVELGFVDQEASLNLTRIAATLRDQFQAIQPSMVVTHAYEGGHPDHDATAFGVHAACRLCFSIRGIAPTIIEFGSYHARGDDVAVLEFLPNGGEVKRVALSAEAQQLKRRMIRAHATQRLVIERFPVEYECFRQAPSYDFTKPPHQRSLYYEKYDWGMSGERFRRLATNAIKELNLEYPF